MKRFLSMAMALVLAAALGTTAYAESWTGGDWHVTFTSDERMYDDMQFDDFGMVDALNGLQPGDDATFYMELSNDNAATTDWYMSNQVLQSLEATEGQYMASGGAYSYDLRYVGPDGHEDVLYTSSRVGGEDKAQRINGEDREGLNEATISLEDMFYLDTLKQGEKGKVTLRVALDGETQGNTYQDTLAQLQMNFAVELHRTTPGRNDITWRAVRTGDETNLLLWSGVMLGCGIAALVLGVVALRRNKKYKEENGDE